MCNRAEKAPRMVVSSGCVPTVNNTEMQALIPTIWVAEIIFLTLWSTKSHPIVLIVKIVVKFVDKVISRSYLCHLDQELTTPSSTKFLSEHQRLRPMRASRVPFHSKYEEKGYWTHLCPYCLPIATVATDESQKDVFQIRYPV